jgi:hypothetical protein
MEGRAVRHNFERDPPNQKPNLIKFGSAVSEEKI